MIDRTKPLDLDNAEVAALLTDVQGNIIKGHGRDHTAQILVRFPDAQRGRRALSALAASRLTSAADQLSQASAFRAMGGPGQPFANLLLSAEGYAALEIPRAQWPADQFFIAGMRRHNDVGLHPVNDPTVTAWEPDLQPVWHAMALLADDDRGRLDADASAVSADLTALGATIAVERGDKLRHDFGPPRGQLEIEHFGHQDGVSNPRMTLQDVQEEVRTRGAAHWDPSAGVDLVLTPDPGAPGAFGSYMVFRKLEQNVKAFEDAKLALARLLEVDIEGAAALIVGRHRDGRPAIPTVTLAPGADPNDFTYAEDSPGRGVPARLCPFHAHIRRTNPRGDIKRYVPNGSDAVERSMRIARRGITYGARPDLSGSGAPPQAGVGLLFMCFVSEIQQFAIQQSGSDDDTFPFVGADTQFSGLEPLIGQAPDGVDPRAQPWPFRDPADPTAVRDLQLMRFVTLKGGEYFFAPSPRFLRGLDAG